MFSNLSVRGFLHGFGSCYGPMIHRFHQTINLCGLHPEDYKMVLI